MDNHLHVLRVRDRNSQSLTPMSNLQPTSNCRGAIYASVTLYVLTKVMHDAIQTLGPSPDLITLLDVNLF